MGVSVKKITTILLFIAVMASLSGVYAVWVYPEEKADPAAENMSIQLSEFVWAPEEILPDTTPGENYLVLLDAVLNYNKGGLNSSKDTLEKAVLKDKLVHSGQNVQGGNLKHLFITEPCKDLDFIVQYISDNEFHVYMYENDDVYNGAVNITNIKVYKTILIENGSEWIGQESQLGYAVLRYFPGTSVVSISPDEWVHGYLPA